jgi:hypothetical protein
MRGGAEVAGQRNGGCDVSHGHPPSSALVRFGHQCSGVSLGASAPVGAPALAVQNAHRSILLGGSISK